MKKPDVTLIILALFITAMAFLFSSCEKVKQCPPTIHYDGCDLEVEYHTGYQSFQWLKKDTVFTSDTTYTIQYIPIPGATDWFIEGYPGKYKCKTVTLDGCPGTSKWFGVTSWCGQQ